MSMIRVVFLGTSASLPTKEHLTSCFALKFEKTMLFDCCEGAQQQLMKYNISFASVDAIFLSHLHADHFLGLFGLIQSMNFSTRAAELVIFGPIGTKRLLETIFSSRQLQPNFPVKITEIGEIGTATEKVIFEGELFTVSAFPVSHGTKAFGYVFLQKPKRRFDKEKCDKIGIKGRMFSDLESGKTVEIGRKKIKYVDVTYVSTGRKIVYSGDTASCNSLSTACKDADIAVLDSTFKDEEKELAKEKKHMTCVQAAKIAQKAKAEKLVLSHFSNRYADRSGILEQARAVFEETVLAQEGLELQL